MGSKPHSLLPITPWHHRDGALSKAKGPEVARLLGNPIDLCAVEGGFAGPRGWRDSGLPIRSARDSSPLSSLRLGIGGVNLPLGTIPADGSSLAPLGAVLVLAAGAYALRGPILSGALQLAGVLGVVQILLTLASVRQRTEAQEEVRYQRLSVCWGIREGAHSVLRWMCGWCWLGVVPSIHTCVRTLCPACIIQPQTWVHPPAPRHLVEALDPGSARDDLQRLVGSLTLDPAASGDAGQAPARE